MWTIFQSIPPLTGHFSVIFRGARWALTVVYSLAQMFAIWNIVVVGSTVAAVVVINSLLAGPLAALHLAGIFEVKALNVGNSC